MYSSLQQIVSCFLLDICQYLCVSRCYYFHGLSQLEGTSDPFSQLALHYYLGILRSLRPPSCIVPSPPPPASWYPTAHYSLSHSDFTNLITSSN
jgi:hypothetical protein